MSSSQVELVVDWCSYQAAKYAVEHWHYSGRMPKSKLVKLGVWENDGFVGAVIFGVGATSQLVAPYGLHHTEGCELVRVALKEHKSPVTRIVTVAIKMLKRQSLSLRLIVSFADPNVDHLGIIYQAGNWIYTGTSKGCYFFEDKNGKIWHPRNVSEDLWRSGKVIRPRDCNKVWRDGKYRYLYPLDRAMRRQILPLSQPYPKKASGPGVNGDTPGFQPGEPGSIPGVRS